MEEKTVRIDGLRIRYFDEGSGEVIVLLHGWLGIKEVYIPIIKRLKKNFRLIALDLPGFGESDDFKDENYSLQKYVDFIEKFTKKLGVKRFNLWGNSYAGVYVLSFVNKYPKLVNKIILHSPLFYFKYLPKVLTNRLTCKILEKTSNNKCIQDVYAKLIINILINKLFLKACEHQKNKEAKFIKELTEKFKKNLETKMSRKAARFLIFQGLRIDLRSNAQIMEQETLIFWGDNDGLNAYRGALELSEIIPKAKLVRLNARPHCILAEDLDFISKEAINFLLS